METLNLEEAARLLRIHKETLRSRAKVGQIPGAKIGKEWLFIKEDLINHIRSQYVQPRCATEVTNLKENKVCQSNVATKSFGSTSRPHQANGYEDLLGL